MSNSKPIIIAMVGRPNVGKSTLFNRLIKKRQAIETDEAGTTRDRLYADTTWRGRRYKLVDTAGLLKKTNDIIDEETQESTKIALQEADIILFLVNYREGVTEHDIHISRSLKKMQKVILVVNKCDSNFDEEKLTPFKRLGVPKMVLTSAISGRNTGDLMDEIGSMADSIGYLNEDNSDSSNQDKTDTITVSLLGRPNAGKSTLLNSIMGEKKMIASSVAGTTRDSQDFEFRFMGQRIIICDTAGIKRKSRVKIGSADGYALLRSYRAIRDSEVVVYLVDAKEGVVSVDQSILGEVISQGRSIILAVNKIDTWGEEREREMVRSIEKLRQDLNFMPWLPVIYISATEKDNITSLLKQIISVHKERFTEVNEEDCQNILTEAKERNSQIHYIKSLHFFRNNPAVFKIATKKNKKPHFSHLRYLENRIREAFPFRGCPIYIDLD
ncbi:MAG: GTPase Der [bacterium ADurb.Bin212]|nr:MAG: GTPase Der [bacterium ADurb.Bin212]